MHRRPAALLSLLLPPLLTGCPTQPGTALLTLPDMECSGHASLSVGALSPVLADCGTGFSIRHSAATGGNP